MQFWPEWKIFFQQLVCGQLTERVAAAPALRGGATQYDEDERKISLHRTMLTSTVMPN